MAPRKHVQVETSDAHDRIIGIDLVADEKRGGGIPGEGEAVVVARLDGSKVSWGRREERNVLDVWIVFLV